MTKIMLVEDDNNLREIYEARLAAEGYDIVSAQDGEAALALAAKEHPQLIITDVMMPKISGFEMLDILRNTEALRNVRVIMLTALGQSEDHDRAGALGADRYMVKSRVTLEDIVKATHELLEGTTPDATVSSAPVSSPLPPVEMPMAVPPQPETFNVVNAPEPSFTPEPSFIDQPVPAQQATTDFMPPSDQTYQADQTDQTDQSAPATSWPQPQAASAAVAPAAEPNMAPVQDDTAAPSDSQPQTDAVTNPAPLVQELPETVAAEVETAPSTQKEESDLMSQIDSYLDDSTTLPADVNAASPVESLDSGSAEQTSAAVDDHVVDLPEVAPDDLPEEEYAKDDTVPDMGEMELHEAPQADASLLTPDAEPVADARATVPADAVIAPTNPSEQMMSNAIDTMMAQNTAAPASPVLPPSEAWRQKEIDDSAATAVEPTPQIAVEQPAEPTVETEPAQEPATVAGQQLTEPVRAETPAGGVSGKKVISPIDGGGRPDIHQLLSMEEAKNAANQAAMEAGAVQQAPAVQPAPAPAPQQPPQAFGSVDPNSVAM